VSKLILQLFLRLLFIFIFLVVPRNVFAATIASQTQGYDKQQNVWAAFQELGNNLSGTAGTLTFRVFTSKPNVDQFDFTANGTRIYDKDNGSSFISPCFPPGQDPNTRLSALSFNTTNVPAGYEDVTLDYSCRNYTFIPGHRYIARIFNANQAAFGGMRIQFAGATYAGTSLDYFTSGGMRYAFDNLTCSVANYILGSTTANNGCNIWTTHKDDLYFVLNNTAPPPKTPVIFIPGIGGSELKTAQDVTWNQDNGHGGTFQHSYPAGEKVWVNSNEAIKLGDDDYFDILRLKADGQTSEAPLALTGGLSSFGYGDIDPFFTSLGFVKDTNYFVFNYDWRKDVSLTKSDLNSLVETAKQKTGQNKVNIVAHSLGGIIARNYIADASKASKVNVLIELGVPHLGTADGIKAILHGSPFGRQIFGDFYIGISASAVKDTSRNFPSIFSLIPSQKYYSFYDNSDISHPYPYKDDRDIDNNKETGPLNFAQLKSLLTNLGSNMTVFNIANSLHTNLDSSLNQSNGVKLYEIVGSNQPTLGQIRETWLFSWPANLVPKKDEIFINGDNLVPLYSASLKSDSLDISAGATVYYTDQTHNDLVSKSGTAMLTVKKLLGEADTLPVEIKSQKITLEGVQISADQDANLDLYDDLGNHTGLSSNGLLETNIPGTFYDTLGDSKHVFIKRLSKKATVKITSPKTTTSKIKIRNYTNDSVSKTTLYNNVQVTPTSPIQFTIDPTIVIAPILIQGSTNIQYSSEATGSASVDQTPPKTIVTIDGATVTLTASDNESGVLKIEYSLDNGVTIETYTLPFTISIPGDTTIYVKATDKVGNEEIPQTASITVTPSSISKNIESVNTYESSDVSHQTTQSSTSSLSDKIDNFISNLAKSENQNTEVLGTDTNEEKSSILVTNSHTSTKYLVLLAVLLPILIPFLPLFSQIVYLAGFFKKYT
jgi:pimeloyl-ACP methyl ester carboxylesterase